MVSDDKEGYEEVDDWIIVEDIPAGNFCDVNISYVDLYYS